VVVGSEMSNILAAPFMWITMDNPILPVANPWTRLLYIREGEIVGRLENPSSYLDNLDDANQPCYIASMEAIKAIITGMLREQYLAQAARPPTEASDSKLEEEETWGPKMTAILEDPLYGSVLELVNIGPEIPEEILPRLKAVLQKNAAAFSVDGRLAQVLVTFPQQH